MSGLTPELFKKFHTCDCGKRKSQWSNRCDKCEREHRAKAFAEARAIVSTGKCPTCGETLKRNLSLSGWYQCVQFGAVGFRKDPSKPSCNFQTFTE